MESMLNDSKLEALLSRLHAQSIGQARALDDFFSARSRFDKPLAPVDAEAKDFLADKLVALDRDKAEFCYALCRSLGAMRVVEAGTSYGVSTLYLAAAVRDNCATSAAKGVVIGTESEPAKAKVARTHAAEAGLVAFIDLREGDLRETLKDIGGPVDFMLVDIWTPMARPALECVAPHLRKGAIVICDNTADPRNDYREYFEFIHSPSSGLRTLTLPFAGGLELSVKCA
jgi:predicted O-methyltransferase YrrM